MIARLLATHHARLARAAGAATLAAQQRRDWPAAARHLNKMHAAQARRDELLRLHPLPATWRFLIVCCAASWAAVAITTYLNP